MMIQPSSNPFESPRAAPAQQSNPFDFGTTQQQPAPQAPQYPPPQQTQVPAQQYQPPPQPPQQQFASGSSAYQPQQFARGSSAYQPQQQFASGGSAYQPPQQFASSSGAYQPPQPFGHQGFAPPPAQQQLPVQGQWGAPLNPPAPQALPQLQQYGSAPHESNPFGAPDSSPRIEAPTGGHARKPSLNEFDPFASAPSRPPPPRPPSTSSKGLPRTSSAPPPAGVGASVWGGNGAGPGPSGAAPAEWASFDAFGTSVPARDSFRGPAPRDPNRPRSKKDRNSHDGSTSSVPAAGGYGASSSHNSSEAEDDESDADDDWAELEPQGDAPVPVRTASGNVMTTYVAEFGEGRKLGMLLERNDEWGRESEQRKERAVVKMVVDDGPAQARGVTVGSTVLAVNDQDVDGLTYHEVLELVKNVPRPLVVKFKRGDAEQPNVGRILYKKTVGVPRSYKTWKSRYFVLGGAVAKAHVLQVYTSKQSYDRMVISVFQRRPIKEKVKVYKLGRQTKVSPIKWKRYAAPKNMPQSHQVSSSTILHYFYLKIPNSRFKNVNFASHNVKDLEELRRQFMVYCGETS
ncbi:unnamed protein product [Chrysoparadoxa australica]